ncbi:hypothetical protein [uncultured Shimia sp.]|uniref:hypothetical protein n=1 Tax=uncultured Shimia sp. TaxID=573152 RepID=UPI0025FA5EEF|nr:hypothetical protein [uncultured Shimia sp.]
MAKRRSREELLAEFHQLYEVLELISKVEDLVVPIAPEINFQKDTPSKQQALSLVDHGRVTLSQVCSGVREAIYDSLETLEDLQEEDSQKANLFLQSYRDLSGRNLWDDIDNPKIVVKAILKRGHLLTEEEFRLIKGQLDAQRPMLSATDRDKAETMLAAFEDEYRATL